MLVQWGEKLVITVTDDGRGAANGSVGGGPGRGLLGLRERLWLYGGELAAGPRAGGGWQVRARSCRWARDRAGEPRMRVVIADDQALVRGGFRLILTAAGFEVVAKAADGAQAVTAVRRPGTAEGS